MLLSDKYYQQFIVNPLKAFDIFTSKYIKGIISYKPDGITFKRMGELIFRDSEKNKKVSYETCISTWQKFLEYSKSNLGGSAVQGGNIYTIGQVDWLYDIPMEDSGCAINDEVVPFYQMVLHGVVDYSGQPGNLTYDYSRTRLQWIEYGCLPFFELTYKGAEEITKTSYNKLYSSSYELWAGTVKTAFLELHEVLEQVQKAFIVKHEKLSRDVVRVMYSNGVEIYINYGEADWKQEGIVVPAIDYIMINPGGEIYVQ